MVDLRREFLNEIRVNQLIAEGNIVAASRGPEGRNAVRVGVETVDDNAPHGEVTRAREVRP